MNDPDKILFPFSGTAWSSITYCISSHIIFVYDQPWILCCLVFSIFLVINSPPPPFGIGLSLLGYKCHYRHLFCHVDFQSM